MNFGTTRVAAPEKAAAISQPPSNLYAEYPRSLAFAGDGLPCFVTLAGMDREGIVSGSALNAWAARGDRNAPSREAVLIESFGDGTRQPNRAF
jgi:hypothetical protein